MTDNVRNGLRVYCGNKEILPPMTQRGTPYQCFRRGFNIGRYVSERSFPRRLEERTKQIEAVTSALTRRQLAQQIQQEGIAVLKRELRLEGLNKDLVRSIAVRFTNTPQAIPRYSSMTRDQLIAELVQRGFQR